MMTKMIQLLNQVLIQNQITQEVMINRMLMYQQVHFPLVIYLSLIIEGDVVQAHQKAVPPHEAVQQVAQEAVQLDRIQDLHHENRDQSMYLIIYRK